MHSHFICNVLSCGYFKSTLSLSVFVEQCDPWHTGKVKRRRRRRQARKKSWKNSFQLFRQRDDATRLDFTLAAARGKIFLRGRGSSMNLCPSSSISMARANFSCQNETKRSRKTRRDETRGRRQNSLARNDLLLPA